MCKEKKIIHLDDLPAISSTPLALMSSSTVLLMMQLRSSNRLCSDSVATYGLLHRSPPSSTSSSNFSHLRQESECQSGWCRADGNTPPAICSRRSTGALWVARSSKYPISLPPPPSPHLSLNHLLNFLDASAQSWP